MDDRKCLQCFEHLKGRADQKFCNDQCRSTYNNLQYMESNSIIKSINRILKKNYLILSMLNAEGKTSVNKEYLMKKGYRFEYFTFTSLTRNNYINYFCYNHGFREMEDNKLILFHTDLDDKLD